MQSVEQLCALKRACEEKGFFVDLDPVRLVSLEDVVSSNIEKIGYVPERDACAVYVKFKGSGVYRYENVTVQEVTELLNAESKGSYFAKNIKPTKKCTKLS